jgi:hypothetical protein
MTDMDDPRVEIRTIVHGCHDCTHFRRRAADAPWPVAGVARTTTGRCGHPYYGNAKQVAEQRRPYRSDGDWCCEWKAA